MGSVPTVTFDFSNLRAAFVNCTLKPSPDVSNTAGLMDVSASIMRAHGVAVDEIRAVDHRLPPGVYPDMTDPAVGTPAESAAMQECIRVPQKKSSCEITHFAPLGS